MRRSCADVNSPYKRWCWTNSGDPVGNSLLWGLHARLTVWVFSLQKGTNLETFSQLSSSQRSFTAGSLIIARLKKFFFCIIFRFSSHGHHLCHTEGLFRRLSVPETKEFQNGDRGSPGINRMFCSMLRIRTRVTGFNWVHCSWSGFRIRIPIWMPPDQKEISSEKSCSPPPPIIVAWIPSWRSKKNFTIKIRFIFLIKAWVRPWSNECSLAPSSNGWTIPLTKSWTGSAHGLNENEFETLVSWKLYL